MKRFTPSVATIGAIVMFAVIGGCATTRSHSERRDDRQLKRQVERELRRNPDVSAREVDVDVLDNTAVLRGDVPDQQTRDLASAEAASVPGISGVDNQLTVIGFNREAYVDEDPDRLFTKRIRRDLRRSGAVKSRDIDVDVFDGEVWLSGFVETERERKAAASLAGDEPGVDAVHNEIRVVGED